MNRRVEIFVSHHRIKFVTYTGSDIIDWFISPPKSKSYSFRCPGFSYHTPYRATHLVAELYE